MKQKMKHLQLMVSVALGVIFAMCFASCSKDDEPNDPKVEKRMTSIDDLRFVYSNGKISQELFHRKLQYEITYHESSIERKYHNDYHGSTSTTVYNLQNGLITSTKSDSDNVHYEFSYENGRLKTVKYYEDEDLDEYQEFEWKDGLIVRQTVYEYDEYVGVMKLLCDYQYTYTNDFDYGGAIACFQDNFLLYDDIPESLIIQGYFGKLPKYLVSGAVDVSGYFDTPRSFSYILDSAGYPLVMNDNSYDDSVSFSWENIN